MVLICLVLNFSLATSKLLLMSIWLERVKLTSKICFYVAICKIWCTPLCYCGAIQCIEKFCDFTVAHKLTLYFNLVSSIGSYSPVIISVTFSTSSVDRAVGPPCDYFTIQLSFIQTILNTYELVSNFHCLFCETITSKQRTTWNNST